LGAAVKVAEHQVPFEWAARRPGLGPEAGVIAAISCS
jgi:hypothetical protein